MLQTLRSNSFPFVKGAGPVVQSSTTLPVRDVLQPGSSVVHFPERSSLTENVSNKTRHGVAKWGYNAQGRAWCRRLGMSASSWDGWAKLHVNPWVAMSYLFSSVVLGSSVIIYMCTGVRGEGHMYYVVLVPLSCDSALCIATTISFWRLSLIHISEPTRPY